MAATELQLPPIAQFLGVSTNDLVISLEQPSREVIQQIYQAILGKASEVESLRAQKLKAEVDLENLHHGEQNRTKAFRATIEKSNSEADHLRGKFNAEEKARSQLQADFNATRSKNTSLAEEVERLRAQAESLEVSRREALSLVESKVAACDELKSDLASQRDKNHEQRRQISELERQVKDLEIASTTSRFSHTRAVQEVEQLQNFNNQLSDEIRAKILEATKYRKEHNVQLSQARQQATDLESTVTFLQTTEVSLRKRNEELSRKVQDGLEQLHSASEQSTREQEQARVELTSTTRLVALHEHAHREAKNRIQELEHHVARLQNEEAQEVGNQRQATAAERAERQAAEAKIVELEQHIKNLEAEGATTPVIPATPASARGSVNGFATPSRSQGLFSGLFTPSSSRIKTGNMTMTQLYSEYSMNKAELDKERQRSTNLRASLDGLMRDLEAKEPEFNEMQEEQQRLQAQVMQLTALLEKVSKERDQNRREARQWQGEIVGTERQLQLLRKQVRDLNHQVLVLAAEIEARDQGTNALVPAEQLLLERMARNEAENGPVSDLSGLDQMIRKRLTSYRNIRELQEQNSSLRQLAREYEMRAEGPEVKQRLEEARKDREQVQSLEVRLGRYQDEIRSLIAKSQSYVKERDMFRRMLQHRGQMPAEADRSVMFGQSVGAMTPRRPSQDSVMSGVEQTPNARDARDYPLMLKELQSLYDSYKEEAAADRKTLREQIDSIAKQKSDMQSQLATCQSNLSLASERYEMLQSNVELFKSENNELRKRMQTVSEASYKQETRTQQAAEDLVEAKALADSMRTELANAKAEKSFFKSVESRLQADNESLQLERSRLNELVVNLQSLQNDRELVEGESKRRLEVQVEEQHREINELRRKLEVEVNDARMVIQKREFDRQQQQTKLDELTKLVSSAREEMNSAQSTRDVLQVKMDQMSVQLRAAEERIQLDQSSQSLERSGPGGGRLTNGVLPASQEQEPVLELEDVKRQLDLAQSDVVAAREDADQYKLMSQEMEEEMQNLSQTQEQFKAEMDEIFQAKNAEIAELNQKLISSTEDLQGASTELASIRENGSEEVQRMRLEKQTLESELAVLTEDAERLNTTVDYLRQDLRAQAEIAQAAQNNYEQAIVNHGIAADAVLKLRADYNAIKTEAMEMRSEAESSRKSLERSTSSWEVRELNYEKEMVELKERQQSADAQNRVLLQQLESFGSQVESFRKSRRLSGVEQDGEVAGGSDPSVESLHEVIKYLRREKDIVDAQHELTIQESTRLRQQLSHAQSQLDETKLKLEQERSQASGELMSSASHKELMEKLTELNLYRESNMTLRAEARDAQERVVQAASKIEELEASLQPFQTQIRQLEIAREVERGELDLLRDDRDRWRERTQSIMSKHEKTDPEEVEALRTQISTLQSERDTAKQEQQAVQEANTGLRERQNKLVTDTKDRLKAIRETLKEKTDQLVVLNAQLETANLELQQVRTEAAESVERVEVQQAEIEELKARIESLTPDEMQGVEKDDQADRDALAAAQAEVQMLHSQVEAAQKQVEGAQKQVEEKDSLSEELKRQSASYQERISELEQSLAQQISALEKLKKETSTTLDSRTEALAAATSNIESLQLELTRSKQVIDELRTQAFTQQIAPSGEAQAPGADAGTGPVHDLDELRRTLEQQYQEKSEALDTRLATRTSKMQQQLMDKLKSGKEEAKAHYEKDNIEALEQLRQEHRAALEELKQAHTEELKTLANEMQAKIEDLEKAKQAAISDATTTPPLSTDVDVTAMSDTQVREMFKSNATAQQILRANVQNSATKSKEAVQKTLTEEYEAKMAEMRRKAELFKEQTQKMNDSRQELLKRQLGTLRAQVGVVTKAVMDTPQKAVVEVWEVAKVAKGPPIVSSSASSGIPTAAPAASRPETPVEASNFTVNPQQAQSPVFAVQTTEQAHLPQKPSQIGQPATRGGMSGIPSAVPRPRGGQVPRGAQRARGGSQQQPHMSHEQLQATPELNFQSNVQSQLPRGGGAGGGAANARNRQGGNNNNRNASGGPNAHANYNNNHHNNNQGQNNNRRRNSRPHGWDGIDEGGASPLSAEAKQFTPANGAGTKREREPDTAGEGSGGGDGQGSAKRARSVGPEKEV